MRKTLTTQLAERSKRLEELTAEVLEERRKNRQLENDYNGLREKINFAENQLEMSKSTVARFQGYVDGVHTILRGLGLVKVDVKSPAEGREFLIPDPKMTWHP